MYVYLTCLTYRISARNAHYPSTQLNGRYMLYFKGFSTLDVQVVLYIYTSIPIYYFCEKKGKNIIMTHLAPALIFK